VKTIFGLVLLMAELLKSKEPEHERPSVVQQENSASTVISLKLSDLMAARQQFLTAAAATLAVIGLMGVAAAQIGPLAAQDFELRARRWALSGLYRIRCAACCRI
jgi:hypothetical protein